MIATLAYKLGGVYPRQSINVSAVLFPIDHHIPPLGRTVPFFTTSSQPPNGLQVGSDINAQQHEYTTGAAVPLGPRMWPTKNGRVYAYWAWGAGALPARRNCFRGRFGHVGAPVVDAFCLYPNSRKTRGYAHGLFFLCASIKIKITEILRETETIKNVKRPVLSFSHRL